MQTKNLLWKAASTTDDHYNQYLKKRPIMKYPPIDKAPLESKDLIYKILEPAPEKRPSVKDILADRWMSEVEKCSPHNTSTDCNSHFFHRHYGPGVKGK
jgi:serine/threonine protein kinase